MYVYLYVDMYSFHHMKGIENLQRQAERKESIRKLCA